MLHRFLFPVLLLLSCLSLPACSKVTAQEQDSKMRFGTVHVFATQYAPRGVVFLFSDKEGWNDSLSGSASALAKAGAVVIGVDLPTYEKGLRESDDGCHYLISEVEELSKEIQRQFKFPRYRTPLLAGIGEGGTLAYAALTQSPYVTVAGAAALNPVPVLSTKVPLCPGAAAQAADGGFSYASKSDLPGIWTYAYTADAAGHNPQTPDWADPAEADSLGRWQRWLQTDPLLALVRPLLASVNGDPAGLDDLPLTPIPAQQEGGDTLAIILSGDGGWRDLDRTIGETLAKGNIAVVGVDTLRYFWQARKPQQVADDLTRIINGYGKLWNRSRILLIGYSFGADVLPATYNLLPLDLQQRIGLISLLGLSETADYQFHVEGWLGMESDSTIKTVPELARIDKNLLMCLYGDDDDEEICTNKVFDGAHRVEMTGGHHFDGNYEELANLIAEQWQRSTPPAGTHP